VDWISATKAAGSFLGAASDLFGSKSDGVDVSESRRLNESQFNQTMRNAKNWGIHPVAMLGNMGTSYTASTAGGTSSAAGIGQAISQAADAIGGKSEKKAMEALGLRQAEGEARKSEAEAQLLELEYKRQLQQQRPEVGTWVAPATEPGVQRLKEIKSPTGKHSYKVGPGPSAQTLEDEYASASELESAYRWWRDRGSKMMSKAWRGSQLHKDLAEFGRVIRAYKRNVDQGRGTW
jgi:hypothetical protein